MIKQTAASKKLSKKVKIGNLETVKRMSAKIFCRQKVMKFSRRKIFADKVFTDKVSDSLR